MSVDEGLQGNEALAPTSAGWSVAMASVMGWMHDALEELRKLRSPEAQALHRTRWQAWTAPPDPVSSSPGGRGSQLRMLVTESHALYPLEIAVTEAGIFCHGEAPLWLEDRRGFRSLVRRRLLHGAWMARRRHADACPDPHGAAAAREAALDAGALVPAYTLHGAACLWTRRHNRTLELFDGVASRRQQGPDRAHAYWALNDHYRRTCVPVCRRGPLPALGLLRQPGGDPVPVGHRLRIVEGALQLALRTADLLLSTPDAITRRELDDRLWGFDGAAGRVVGLRLVRTGELVTRDRRSSSDAAAGRLHATTHEPEPAVAARLVTRCGRVIDAVFHDDCLAIEENGVPIDAAEAPDGSVLTALAHLAACLVAPHLDQLQWQLAPRWGDLARAAPCEQVPELVEEVELAAGSGGRPSLVLRRTGVPLLGRLVPGWEVATGRLRARTLHGRTPLGALLAQVFEPGRAVRRARRLMELTSTPRSTELC